ncbi:putative regulator of gluconeogenesis Rmd5 [Microthyrium microscopicum]|uniref:GID complex catalytic subunit 2 n=1 Tax=Microthyrium microscopicum TaxID=703497 RepID=A0A6A6U3I8_9PEZI|nr:putative regulator of gluconeogenesis Rmd5 [Microthyrium microscopicum]
MDDLMKEHARFANKASFSKTQDSMQQVLAALEKARADIVANPNGTPLHITKAKSGIKSSFDVANSNLKDVNSASKSYEKALNKVWKLPVDDDEEDALASQSYLINRAIAMHLLREGQFDVASTFFREANEASTINGHSGIKSPNPRTDKQELSWEIKSERLQAQFAEMYHILDELKNKQNLDPAITWATNHSEQLESRGSNLEFELCRLRFVSLFLGYDGNGNFEGDVDMDADDTGYPASVLRAATYAREAFAPFQDRYMADIHKLVGAMAYWQNMPDSPYADLFSPYAAWDDVCSSFTREFCSLLGLSPSSPLFIACTAGSIALPILSKVRSIMRTKRTEWTTQEELPVEIPLPPDYMFHSIFVCPVSKEQATDANPPKMMPCGHVICYESLKSISKNARFKCPYCPAESHPKEAKSVYL